MSGETRRAPIALYRRSTTEQRVIRMIRGEEMARHDYAAVCNAQFEKLRFYAARNDLSIQEPGTRFLSITELNLLAWLAQAQRVASYTRSFHADPMLTMTIVHCAGTLDALGIRLPALAMHNPNVQPDIE
ncbi:hypothetical protein D6851_05575 [Altericroceibacterium spongiae]|uniref:Uncharacterized protein n=1 Tax=Altericroceibacterium spongiae TaxID=2320269 RepID=A0A420EPS7_9SPHN|nr:hypothetical protein [Altericroceibacterium spongiae]RKF22679.1 hypothetical protein D6851_05575 [Altericroceibacterium spongiae]